MKKSTIALAAAVLLLSGSFATAGAYEDVEPKAKDRVAAASAKADVEKGAHFDLEENGNRARRPFLTKPQPREDDDPTKGGRYIDGICLNAPVLGQLFCI